MNSDEIIRKAVEVLKIEADGITNLAQRIDENFSEMVELICDSSGRLIIGGIGKSGIVGRKIVATLNSTGTRSLFLHPVEAMHGDLGQVSAGDIFIALSKSGETDELNILLPSIRRIGCKIIAFTGNKNSTLANHSDIVIDVGVECEACPLGLAPTASTTALLAMGDALAVVLLEKKHFKPSDFKMIHPGGDLGQRLSGKIWDLVPSGKSLPRVADGTSMKEAVKEIERGGLGTTVVLRPTKQTKRNYYRRRYPAHGGIRQTDFRTYRRRYHDQKSTRPEGGFSRLRSLEHDGTTPNYRDSHHQFRRGGSRNFTSARYIGQR